MELIERYLQAVGFWLPEAQKQDILAELRDDLQAQIEDREGALGRALTAEEVRAFVKEQGRPVLVATKYLPQRQLIGPLMFPIYWMVLRIALVCTLVPTTAVWVAMSVYVPAGAVARAWDVGGLLGSLWTGGFLTAAVVTLVFAVLERVQEKKGFLEQWEPKELPQLRNPRMIDRTNSGFELAINLIFGLWWATHATSPVEFGGRVQIELAPLWAWFQWGFAGLALLNAALALANLMRPYWSVARAGVKLVLDAAGGGMFCWLLTSHPVQSLSISGVPAEKVAEILRQSFYWMEKSAPVAALVCAVAVAFDAWRMYRLRPGGVKVAPASALLVMVLLVVAGSALPWLETAAEQLASGVVAERCQ